MIVPPRAIPVFGHVGSDNAAGEIDVTMYKQETGETIAMPAGGRLILTNVYCGTATTEDAQLRWSVGENSKAIFYNNHNGTTCPTIALSFPNGRHGPMGAKVTLTTTGAGACVGGFVGYLIKPG